MPAISIIMPVYNAEAYLRRAVQSIQNQTFADWELLLIDDGSKDASGALCDTLAKEDARILVTHKENGGTSAARNVGLSKAQGEYIAFMDNDDYALPYWLEDLYSAAVRENADIVRAGHFSVGDEGRVNPPQTQEELLAGYDEAPLTAGVYSGKEYFHDLATWCACPIWGQISKRTLQVQCPFPEGHLAEDILVCLALSRLAQTVVYVPRIAYCWVQRKTSQAQTSPLMGVDSVAACDEIITMLEAEHDTARIQHCLMRKTEMLFYGPLSVGTTAQFGITEQAKTLWLGVQQQEKQYHFLHLLPQRVRMQYAILKTSFWLYKQLATMVYKHR